jgi:SMC interacting uncharacterized protein involved in chromosome segregation
MNNLETLKATYSKTLQRLGKYQSAENHAHNKVKEYTEKLERILKEIKEIEENKYKLNECIDFIKHYCREAKCDDCQFNAPYNVCNLAKPPIDW